MASKRRNTSPVAVESLILNQTAALVPTDQVHPHPENPRQGNLELLEQSIRTNGFYGFLVVQKSTSYILAGNHRWRAARAIGLTEVPVVWVDVSDAKARKILLADNRTSDLASNDLASLTKLLQEVCRGDDLLGTGYGPSDLDGLLKDLQPITYESMQDQIRGQTPEQVQQSYLATPVRQITLIMTEPEYLDTLERFGQIMEREKLHTNTEVVFWMLNCVCPKPVSADANGEG